jgi:hypothetical protein
MRCRKVVLREYSNRVKKTVPHMHYFIDPWKTCFIINSGASNNAIVWGTVTGHCVTLDLKKSEYCRFLCTFYSKILLKIHSSHL